MLNQLRYEKKFITNLTEQEVEQIIKNNLGMFSEIFHKRQINNIYLDTINKKSFYENIDGINKRFKMRIRWYGNRFGSINNPTLEIKTKINELGGKLSFKIKPFNLSKKFDFKELINSIKDSELPDSIMEKIKNMEPSLLNSYIRKYFISSDKKSRITIDTNLEYFRITKLRISPIKFFDNKIIIELKYKKEDDSEIIRITNDLPFRLYKNSKYINGCYLINYSTI